jgi:hypothetical protein
VRALERLRRVRAGGDDGQVVLLVIAYCTIALALVLVVTSASAVHLERKRLLEVADAAALDAADEVAEEIYFPGGATPGSVPVTDASVRAAVERHLDDRGALAEFDDLTIGAGTGSPDGQTAQVTLYATVEPPLIGWAIEAFSGGVPLQATSRARVATR